MVGKLLSVHCADTKGAARRSRGEYTYVYFWAGQKDGMLMEVQALRTALDAKYPLVRLNTAEDWNELSARMLEATNTYVIGD